MSWVNPLTSAIYVSLVRLFTGVTITPATASDINLIPALSADSGVTPVFPANTATDPLHVTTDAVAVSITGTIGQAFPIPNGTTLATQTVINIPGAAAGNTAGDTLYTVTAAKKFYCTGLTISTADATGKIVRITTSSPAVDTFVGLTGVGTPIFVSATGGVLFVANATSTIKINGNFAASNAFVTVWGYEM